MTPTCCYAIYEASACRASMGRMLLGRNSFVAFRGKPTGSLVAMKIDFSLARSPCTWNWVSMLVCSVPEHVSRLFQIYSFLCFGLVFGVTPPKKTTDKNQVHFVTWVTCDKRFGWQIFDLLVFKVFVYFDDTKLCMNKTLKEQGVQHLGMISWAWQFEVQYARQKFLWWFKWNMWNEMACIEIAFFLVVKSMLFFFGGEGQDYFRSRC